MRTVVRYSTEGCRGVLARHLGGDFTLSFLFFLPRSAYELVVSLWGSILSKYRFYAPLDGPSVMSSHACIRGFVSGKNALHRTLEKSLYPSFGIGLIRLMR